jgi:hypothetical protein
MIFNKPHLEFHALDLTEGWETPRGYPPGIKQKILASDVDETHKTGSRSRLLGSSLVSSPRPRLYMITGRRRSCFQVI